MNSAIRLLAILTLMAAAPAWSADEIRLGNAVLLKGRNAQVKVYLRDLSGSSLNVSNGSPHRIQGFAFRMAVTPASAVTTITATRIGACAAFTPVDELQADQNVGTDGLFGYFVHFDVASAPLALTQDAAAPGDQCLNLVVTVQTGFVGVINLTLDPSDYGTVLVGGDGSIEETIPNGELALVNGVINAY